MAQGFYAPAFERFEPALDELNRSVSSEKERTANEKNVRISPAATRGPLLILTLLGIIIIIIPGLALVGPNSDKGRSHQWEAR
jgi:hypothetical protein